MSTAVFVHSEIRQRIRAADVASLAGMLLAFLAVMVHSASHTPLWFDELSTYFLAAKPTLNDIVRAAPWDGSPPLYFLAAHLSLRLPLSNELALRLPSLVAYLLAAVTVYRFVYRAAGVPICALLAAAIFLGSGVNHYGVEARPYALLLLLAGVVLCCWQEKQGKLRWLALSGVAVGIFTACVTHPYGVIYTTVPMLSAECVESWRRKHIDLPLIAAALAGSAGVLLVMPPILRLEAPLAQMIRSDAAFWAHPGWNSLAGWPALLPPLIPFGIGLAAIAAAVQGMVMESRITSQTARPVPYSSLIAALALVMFYPLFLLLTHFTDNYFVQRYASGTAMGVAMAAGIGLSALLPRLPLFYAFIPSITLYFVTVGLCLLYLSPFSFRPIFFGDSFVEAAPGREPVVIADAVQFPAIWWYAGPVLRSRLHYLSDLDYAAKRTDPLPEYWLAQQPGLPIRVDAYTKFLREHPRFLLYSIDGSWEGWIQERLERSGWTLRLVSSKGPQRLYEASAPGLSSDEAGSAASASRR